MSRKRRKPSLSTVAVLKALGDGYRHGFDIIDTTGLAGGTVYPILARLERDDLVRSSWEDPKVAQREKRPARRYYTLNARGLEVLETALAQMRAMVEKEPQPLQGAPVLTAPEGVS